MNTGLLLAVIGVVTLVVIVECMMILRRDNDKKISCEKRQKVCLLSKEASKYGNEKSSKLSNPQRKKGQSGKVIYLKDWKKESTKHGSKKPKAVTKSMQMNDIRKINHSNSQWWI